jgi:hypothetical protein
MQLRGAQTIWKEADAWQADNFGRETSTGLAGVDARERHCGPDELISIAKRAAA